MAGLLGRSRYDPALHNRAPVVSAPANHGCGRVLIRAAVRLSLPNSGVHHMSTVRQEAIRTIACAKHQLNRVDFKTTHIKDLFGINVFSEEVQKQRLPKPVFKALQKTIKQGAPLDPTIADAVPTAMKDWDLEKGATYYTHLFHPMTGTTAEKHDSFLSPDGAGGAIA